MRPASTVGTRVSLLPSPTPNSCSFPELSRLGGGGRKRVRLRRQGKDAEAEAAGEGCALCWLGRQESFHPHLFGPQIQGPGVGGSPSGRGNPMLTVQTPSLKEPPTLDWGNPPLHLTKALFHHPGLSVPRTILSTTPRPTLPIIHGLRPRAPLCGTTRLT